jgi:Fungal chitosanase of glycosyl hydrolase group 75
MAALVLCGCDAGVDSDQGTRGASGAGGKGGAGAGGRAGTGGRAGASSGGTSGAASGGSGGSTGGTGGSAGVSTGPSASELLALTKSCQELTLRRYAADAGDSEQIAVCALNGAVFWHADMDIDCDGRQTSVCNASTDPAYQPTTSAVDSNGDPLDASELPFMVIPLPSERFDYRGHGIELGSVAAVIFNGRVEYGAFADQGPSGIIGEASYAMAERLGIDPDPATGGVPEGVSYLVFTGPSGQVGTIEDHAEAVSVGAARARQLLTEN